MDITVTMKVTPERLDLLKRILEEDNAEAAKSKTRRSRPAESVTQAVMPTEIKAEEKTEDVPPFEVSEPTEPTPTVSKSDIRAVALKLSKAGKAETLKKIFATFGAEKLGDIPEAKYGELMQRLVAVDG